MWFDGKRQPDTIYVASVSRGKDSTAMLRAIQLLGFPLDMIVSVDVWATKDIPAELPPMVAFKDEWDKKCLDTFGLPVTRLCAQKTQAWISRERERAIRTTENVTHDAHTRINSIASENQESSSAHTKDSQCQSDRGVKKLKTENMLTYEDIFYSTISPKNKEKRLQKIADDRERERTNLRIPASQGNMVQRGAQTISTFGFPNQKCPWCTGDLKRNVAKRDGLLTAFRDTERIGATVCSKQEFSTARVF